MFHRKHEGSDSFTDQQEKKKKTVHGEPKELFTLKSIIARNYTILRLQGVCFSYKLSKEDEKFTLFDM